MNGPPPAPSVWERAVAVHGWRFWDDNDTFRPCVLLSWRDEAGRLEFEICKGVDAVAAIEEAMRAYDARNARALKSPNGCEHRGIGLYRVGPRVAELCDVCGVNFRGAGRWVSKAELIGVDTAALPASRWRTKTAAAEPDLFRGKTDAT